MRTRIYSTFLAVLVTSPCLFANDFERLHGLVPADVRVSPYRSIDFDSDGDLDVVFGDYQYGVSLLVNEGNGRFSSVVLVSDPINLVSFSVGDMTGDGNMDLVMQAPAEIRLYVGSASLTFTQAPSAFSGTLGHRAHIVGDADGDGDLDVLSFASFPATQNILFLNSGAGTFTQAPANLPAAANTAGAFIDVDGDGDDDLITLGPQSLLRNDGTGVFTEGNAAVLPPLVGIGGIHDVDLDGDLDILHGVVQLASNDGTGNFTAVPTGLTGLLRSVPVDWDGVGGIDLIARPINGVPSGQSTGLRVYVNTGGAFQQVSLPTLEGSTIISEFIGGDWDGDGDGDILTGTSREVIYLNAGTGNDVVASLVSPEQFLTNCAGAYVGDLDGDGFLDGLAIFRQAPHSSYWFRNDGAGGFDAPIDIGVSASSNHALLDFDGDGDLDILSILDVSPFIDLQENLGGGLFADSNVLPPLPGLKIQLVTDLGIGDLNADGADDILLMVDASYFVPEDYVLLSDGNGGIGLAPSTSLIPATARAGELGDLDADGDLDAVVQVQDRFISYENPGDGDLQATARMVERTGSGHEFTLGDMDGNGTLDLVIAYEDAGTFVDIFLGDGTGGFAAQAAARLTRSSRAYPWAHIAVLDADRDGDRDIYLNDGHYFRNDGGLVFEDRSGAISPPDVTASFSNFGVGDLDLDGDPDVWHSGSLEIHWNVHRQVAWRTWPSVGKPLTMDLDGPAGGFFDLWVSLASTNLSTRWGRLRIDVTLGSSVARGVLDADGEARLSFAVPADPNLLGVTVYWQAVFGAPLELSNLETTLLTNV